MAQDKRTTVSMHFSDGSIIQEWTSFSLRDTYTDPLSELRFDVAPSQEYLADYRRLLRKGELVTIKVNGVNQGGFIIQTRDTRVSPQSGVSMSVVCNAPLITPYQATANPDLSFATSNDAPVIDFVLKILSEFGFSVAVTDSRIHVNAISGRPVPGSGAAPIAVQALKHGEAKIQDGETAYAAAARILTRLGMCLRFTEDNQNILVCRPDYDQQPAYAIVQSADVSVPGDRWIADIDIHETNDNQFSECRVRGQRNDTAGATTTAPPDATVQAFDVVHPLAAYTSTAMPFKPLILKDKSCVSLERATSVAKLALGGRAKDAFAIGGEVDGLVSQTGRIWTVDTIASVRIDVIDFQEPMWLLERVLMQDAKGGQHTRLKVIPPGTLTLGDIPG